MITPNSSQCERVKYGFPLDNCHQNRNQYTQSLWVGHQNQNQNHRNIHQQCFTIGANRPICKIESSFSLSHKYRIKNKDLGLRGITPHSGAYLRLLEVIFQKRFSSQERDPRPCSSSPSPSDVYRFNVSSHEDHKEEIEMNIIVILYVLGSALNQISEII